MVSISSEIVNENKLEFALILKLCEFEYFQNIVGAE